MKTTQVIGSLDNLRKIHLVKNKNKFLCGTSIAEHDLSNISKYDFSKGYCLVCKKVYERKYKKDFNFLMIKLKLGAKT